MYIGIRYVEYIVLLCMYKCILQTAGGGAGRERLVIFCEWQLYNIIVAVAIRATGHRT